MPRPKSSRVIWNGNPGEAWHNDTGIVRYQFICDFANSCGVCIQYHLAISNWWPIPIHRNCRCKNSPVFPGAAAQPFEDFRRTLDKLDHHAQVEAIGASNYRLLDSGVVEWGDIVTPTRVLDLKEVVNAKNLSVQQLVDAGVRRDIAERAYAESHTATAQIVRAARQQALKNLEAAGISREQIHKQVAHAIGQKVGIGTGPSGPSRIIVSSHRRLPTDLLGGLRHFRPTEPIVPPKPPIKPGITNIHEAVRLTPHVERAAKIANKAGFNVAVMPGSAFKNARAAATYVPKLDVIKINADAKHWRDPAAEMRYNYDEGWSSTANADHTMIHEIGHGNHFRAIGRTEQKIEEMKQAIDPALQSAVRVKVSEYAAMNRAEFVAEVYAGLQGGRNFPKDIMDYYALLGGPTP